jgi:ATP-dependent Clp protease protease subunit
MIKMPAIFNAVTPLRRKPDAMPAPAASGYRVVARGKRSRRDLSLRHHRRSDWFGDGVTAKQVRRRPQGARQRQDDRPADQFRRRLGVRRQGDVFLLNEHKAKIIVHIDGLAASAASFVAMAGDEIEIAEGGFVMIHNAYMSRWATPASCAAADMLDTVNGTIIDVYVARTKGDRKAIIQMMDDETWMTGAEAVKNGFADKMVENLKVAASVVHPDRFKKIAAALKPNHAAPPRRCRASPH